MQITFFATYRQIVGQRAIEIPDRAGRTLRELVDEIVALYPALRAEWLDESGELLGHVHFFVNGRDAAFLPDGLQTVLKADDDVKVFPPVGGG